MSMNLRSKAIMAALAHVFNEFPTEPLNVIEVGSMYNEHEGLSTYLIADALAKRPAKSRFVTIDWDPEHLASCHAIVNKRNPSLNGVIEYREGHSLALLPSVLKEIGTVQFALLDGGEHPEVCLAEFELVTKHLAPEGALLVDDAQPIPEKSDYKLQRPLGKVNLVLPMLLIDDYLQHRNGIRAAASDTKDPRTVPDARFINELQRLHAVDDSASFCVIGTWHRMLAYGSPKFVEVVSHLSDVGLMRRAARGVLDKLGLG
jgi:predicted O-methyltransferase YrrM